MTIMKTSMIAIGLVALVLASMAGVGYVSGWTQKQKQALAVVPNQDDPAPKADAAAPEISVRTVQSKAVTLKQQ
jgi:hypothetical protein